MSATMEVQLLRGPSGDVIFLEANAEFVDVLVKLLCAPLGAVLQSCADEGTLGGADHPFLHLTASIPRLREAVFRDQNERSIIPEPLSFDKLMKRREQGDPSTECLLCLKTFAVKREVPGPACASCGFASRRVSMLCPMGCSQQVPSENGTCPQCTSPIASYLTFQQILQKPYCAKCVSSGRSAQLTASRTCTACGAPNTRTCCFCQWCDECTIKKMGFHVPGGPRPRDAPGSAVFKDTAKFLVTDALDIFEASPAKMVELLSSAADSFRGVKTCAVRVAAGQLRQLVLRGLLGSTRVLTETFSGGDAESELELGSEAGTEGSFELIFYQRALDGRQ